MSYSDYDLISPAVSLLGARVIYLARGIHSVFLACSLALTYIYISGQPNYSLNISAIKHTLQDRKLYNKARSNIFPLPLILTVITRS
jgi:hypothetical protein